MSLSVSTQVSPVGTKLIKETAAGATPDTDVTGAAGTLYTGEVDNTGNAGTSAYLKIYNAAAPAVGTTAPDLIIQAKPSQRQTFALPLGWAFTNLSFACVTSPGTAGSTAPAVAVPVWLVAS
jgi:hypothetical protein